MAEYVDVVNGSDSTGDGSSGSPWQTITKAIDNATTNETIFVHSGIYTETLLWQGSPGANVRLVAIGRVIIDGEDVRPSIASGPTTLGGSTYNNIQTVYFFGFIFRDPLDNKYIATTTVDTIGYRILFYNCVFYDTNSNTTGCIIDPTDAVDTSSYLSFYSCTFERFGAIYLNTATPHANWNGVDECKWSIIELTNTFGSITPATDTENAYAGGSFINTSVNAPVYVDETYGVSEDLSLDRSDAGNQSDYLGVGVDSDNYSLMDIGATWHVALGLATALASGVFTDQAGYIHDGTDYVNDSNYEDGNTKGPAAWAASTYWTIDVLTQPSAQTAAVLGIVYKVTVQNGRTATLKHSSWLAEEDTAPSSGSKDVVDADSGATRTVQYRASTTPFDQTDASPSWTDMNRNTVLATTFTQNFYVQQRIILTLVGD